ncbi:hypothetical protein WOLCODRAFT_124748, partial [Wolfiporia cocos MD-104 SS10]
MFSILKKQVGQTTMSQLCRCTRSLRPVRIADIICSRSARSRPFTTSPRRPARYVRFSGNPERPFDPRGWDLGSRVVAVLVLAGGVYYVSHLEQVPETGRWRFMDVSPKYEAKLAKASRDEILHEFRGKILPEHHPLTRHVQRVVTRILEANNLGTLASSEPRVIPVQGPTDDLWASSTDVAVSVPPEGGGKEWNLVVINDDRVVNAAASYGNIMVFTGILPVAKDEQGLAAILSHEIGHVVARHNSERYSSVKVLLALATLLEVVGLDVGIARLITALLYDLPNSRTQEYEADQIGLNLASKACFDPRAAPEMFRRLGQLEQSKGRPILSFVSTHPSSEARVKRLEELLPTAYAVQAASSECGGVLDSLAAFRDMSVSGPWSRGDESASL